MLVAGVAFDGLLSDAGLFLELMLVLVDGMFGFCLNSGLLVNYYFCFMTNVGGWCWFICFVWGFPLVTLFGS